MVILLALDYVKVEFYNKCHLKFVKIIKVLRTKIIILAHFGIISVVNIEMVILMKVYKKLDNNVLNLVIFVTTRNILTNIKSKNKSKYGMSNN